jgi:hypothetical protein
MMDESRDKVFRRGGGVTTGYVIHQGGEGQSFEWTICKHQHKEVWMLAQELTERAPRTELGHVHNQRVAVHLLGTLEPPRTALPVASAVIRHGIAVVTIVNASR